MTKIVLLNGPPRCGKDTAANFILDTYPKTAKFDRFAMPLKRAFAAMIAASCDKYGVVEPFESAKEAPIPFLGGITYRQWQIDFSENFMKGRCGEDIFGKLFCMRNTMYGDGVNDVSSGIIAVPDSGFQTEVDVVTDHFGEKNCMLIRIHRLGRTFAGDSRSYLPGIGMTNVVDVENDGSITDFHATMKDIIVPFAGEPQPQYTRFA